MLREAIKTVKKEQDLFKIRNPILKQFVAELWDFSRSPSMQNKKIKKTDTLIRFCEKFQDVNPEDIEWEFLCVLVDENPAYGFPCMRLLYFLLTNGLYSGNYKDILLEIAPCFDVGKKGLQERVYKRYFVHDDIKYIFYFEKSSNCKLFYIKTDNVFLLSLFKTFCSFDRYADSKPVAIKGRDWFWENISMVMGKYNSKIICISDFNYSVFHQMEMQCKKSPYPEQVLRKVYRFFAFLIEHPSGEGLAAFKDSDPMDYNALKRDDLAKRVLEGFKYIYYNPHERVPTEDRWILHINGYDRGTTKLKATASKLFNFTRIKSDFYKDIAKSYFWNETRCNFNTKYEHFICLTETLNRLTNIKNKSGEPENHITINETSYIRLWLNNQDLSLDARTQKIVVFRQLLLDMETEQQLEIEYMALDYLKQFRRTKSGDPHAIPDHDLEKLNRVMIEHAGDSLQNAYCYTILHILLQTEFRLSQVCHLNTGAILPTVNRNQFILTNSKTSNGQIYEAVITDFTKSLLDDAEKLSSNNRQKCPSEENNKYLFLYKTTENQYVPIEGRYFRDYMFKCCDKAGINHYTPANLRDFHMTKAEEENLRKGYSDMRLRTLSGHAHVDTTRNHYIEMKLTQIIESMYGIIIGNVDLKGNVVYTIPNEFNDKRHSVESGCGHCVQNSCIDDTMISCLLCKEFHTTVDKLPRFKTMMAYMDDLIKAGKWVHDKEDLVNKKRLIAAYILAIETSIAEKEGVTE